VLAISVPITAVVVQIRRHSPGQQAYGRACPEPNWRTWLKRFTGVNRTCPVATILEGMKSMRLNAIAIGRNPPEDVNVVIEVAIGGEPIKYEMDKKAGTLVVDRFLYTPTRYPGNYGFVPHTLSEDGDPIDVLVANTRPIVPGAVINVRPIGVLKMVDDSGKDEKILAVPSPKLTQRYVNINNYTDLPQITLEQVRHFFEHYKDLEPGKWVKVQGWGDAAEARTLIMEAIERDKKRKAS
jgi:inorganic pyrophosphatase